MVVVGLLAESGRWRPTGILIAGWLIHRARVRCERLRSEVVVHRWPGARGSGRAIRAGGKGALLWILPWGRRLS